MTDPSSTTDLAQATQWRSVASVLWLVLLLTWETWAPYFREFPNWKERGRHAVRNMAMAGINGLLTAFGFVLIWKWVADWSAQHDFGLLHLLPMPPVVHALIAVLLFDLWTYWWHRWAHEIPFLWRFHRMHHSDPTMDVTTANRFHPGEILISSILRIPLIALLGLQFWHVVLYETLLQILVQLQHANIGFRPRIDGFLRVIFVTPLMHKVHHSRLQPETDSNYASLFSFWDRLFRSFRLRTDPKNIRFGLDGFDDTGHQRFVGLLRTPLGFQKGTEERKQQKDG